MTINIKTKIKIIFIIIIAIQISFLPVNMQSKNFHEINLNNSGINYPISLEHSFCKMSNGDIVTIWAFKSDLLSYGIQATFTYPSSFTNSNMFVVKSGISSKSIALGCLTGGGFVVAWYHNQFIFVVLYNNSGIVIKEESQVNNTAIIYEKFSLATQTNGGFLIFYCRDQIYYRSANSNGQFTGSQGSTVVNTITQNFKSLGLSNGYTIFAWISVTNLNFKIIKNDGNSITNTQTVSYSTASIDPKFDIGEIKDLGFVMTWEYSLYQSVDIKYYTYEGTLLKYNYKWSTDYIDFYGLKNPHVLELTNKNHLITFQYVNTDGNLLTKLLFHDSFYNVYFSLDIISRSMNKYKIIPYFGLSFVILYNNSENILSIIFFPSCRNITMSVKNVTDIDMKQQIIPQENTGNYKIVNSPTTGTLTINNSNNYINQLLDLSNPIKFTPDSADSKIDYSLSFPQYFGGEARCSINLKFFCHSSCFSCDEAGTSADHKCTQCRNSYYPLSDKTSQCYQSTEVISGYYFNVNIFKKCKSNCIRCTSDSTCTQCEVPFTAINNQCLTVISCPTNSFLDTSTSLNGNCVSQCPDYYYGDNSTKLCLKCPLAKCKNCSNDTGNCILCESPYLLQNQTCISSNITCPLRQYFNDQNMMCSPCSDNCSICLNNAECTTCLENFLITQSKQCVATCPPATYQDGTTCKICMLNCESCINATTCIKCIHPFNLLNGSCIVDCPVNYYSNGSLNQCISCLPNCESCDNIIECKKCSPGFYLNSLKSCVSECGLNLYEDYATGKCENCILNCEECSNGLMCSKCKSNFYLKSDGTCHDTCPTEYYPDILNRKCLPCGLNCESCIDGQTCNKCKSNFFLNYLKICVDHCDDGYFNDISTGMCESCIVFCKNCTNRISCDVCNTNYTLQSDKSCKGECADGSFYNPIEGTCNQCLQNCRFCNDGTSCLVCLTNYFLDKQNGCTQECGSYLYEDPSKGKCENCISNCEECNNNSRCVKCVSNFFLLDSDGTCKSDCPIGYYPDNYDRACKACDSTCESCVDANNCDKCKSNYFLNSSNKCVSNCGAFLFEDSLTGKCQSCLSNCEKCTNNYICLKCEEDYFLQPDNTTCKDSCTIEYFKNETDRKCWPCKPNCEVCKNSDDCDKCKSNYFLQMGTNDCVGNCGVEYFGNVGGKCENCLSNCEDCTNDIECNKCLPDFFLQSDKQCLDSCPQKYYENKYTRTCDNCSDYCDYCINKNRCITCEFPFFLSDLGNSQICVLTCPDGYYADVDTGRCNALINICNIDNPCQNEGKCSVKDNAIVCDCPKEYFGSRCSEKVSEEKDPNEDSSKQDYSIENLPDDSEKLIDYANDEIEKMLSGEIPPDPNILVISNNAIDTKINTLFSSNSTNVNLTKYQQEVNNMKESIYDIANVLLENRNLTNQVLVTTDLFSVQLAISDKSNKQDRIETARKKNLTIVEYGECEKEMIRHYKIPDDMPLLIKQIDYSSNLNLSSFNDTNTNSSSTIIFEFRDPRTKQKLDPMICNNVTVIIKSPNKKSFGNLNITKYQKLNENGVDMFDPNSEAFKSRCYILKDPDTGKDTTANYRIEKYFGNKKAECAKNCKYAGLDEFGWVICSCLGLPLGEEKANSVQVEKLIKLPQMNFEIVTCIKVTFKYPELFYNPALYIAGSFILISLIVSKLLYKLDMYIINKRINELIHFDCQFFDKENLSKEDYFNFKNKKKVIKNPNWYNKIQANIDDVHPSKIKKDETISFIDKIVSPSPVGVNPIVNEINKENNEMNICFNPSNVIIKKQKKKSKKLKRKIKIKKNFDNQNTDSPNTSNGQINSRSNTIISENGVSKNLQTKRKLINQKKQNFTPYNSTDSNCYRNSVNNLVDKELPAKIPMEPILEDMRIYTMRYRNIYEKDPNHSPTLRDYEELSPYDAVLCDRRSFKQMFLNNLTQGHIVLELIFKVSILNPLWVRILLFFFNLTLLFAMNAIFFTDDLIDKRADSQQPDNFLYTLVQEFSKTLLSVIFTMIILTVMNILVSIPNKYKHPFNESLKTRNPAIVRKAYYTLRRQMRKRYLKFLISLIVVNLLCWYYVVIFCGVYFGSSRGWINGSIIGIVLNWCVISVVFPILRTAIRLCVRKYERLRFLVSIEYLFVVKEFLG